MVATTDCWTESALYVSRLKRMARNEARFDRLYFGNEFCERLLPSCRALHQALDFATKHDLTFTLVTPYVTEKGLGRVEALLKILKKEKPASEVVFNDWGVLRKIHEAGGTLEPVLGRRLNKMKRGPRLMHLLEFAPGETIECYRGCSLDVPVYQAFLLKQGVRRVELDYPLQGLSLDLSRTGLRGSVYTPYAYVTTTRLCLASGCEHPEAEDRVDLGPCKRECRKYTFSLRHPVLPTELIRKGNTHFLRNEELPERLEERGIDRIVFQPDVPM